MSESKSITLYKRNAQGKPIFWSAEILGHKIILKYGIVGKIGTTSEYTYSLDTQPVIIPLPQK